MVITISNNIVTIKPPCDTPIQSLKVYFSPIQNGSGDPSPTNVRPITGWTGLDVTRCGRNLYDKSSSGIIEGKYIDSTGAYASNASSIYWHITDFIPTLGVKSIRYYRIGSSGNAPYCAWYDKNKNLISTWKHYDCTPTKRPDGYVQSVPNNAAFMRMSIGNGEKDNTMIIHGDSLISEYEPYFGVKIPIDWSSEAGTLYGGYVDLISGELVATHKVVTYTGASTETWIKDSSLERYIIGLSDVEIMAYATRMSVISNIGLFRSSGGQNFTIFAYQYSSSGNKILYYYPPSTVTDVSSFRQWLSEYNLQVCYKLATPITYHLDSSQLNILRGHNNIFSNANGKCEVTYDHRDTLDILSARKTVMLGMDAANLYKGGDITFTTLKTLVFPLPPGTYRFSAVITSNDTDSTTCLTRFMQQDDTEAATELKYLSRSVNGEYRSADFVCPNATHHLYFYSSNGYDKSRGDTATYRNIRIERIG